MYTKLPRKIGCLGDSRAENGTASEKGVDEIINHLTRLYQKDSIAIKYQVLEASKMFRRPCNMSMQSFINEFEKRLYKTKPYCTEMTIKISKLIK